MRKIIIFLSFLVSISHAKECTTADEKKEAHLWASLKLFTSVLVSAMSIHDTKHHKAGTSEAQRRAGLVDYPERFLVDTRYCTSNDDFYRDAKSNIDMIHEMMQTNCKILTQDTFDTIRNFEKTKKSMIGNSLPSWKCPSVSVAREYFENTQTDLSKLSKSQFCLKLLELTKNHYDICMGKKNMPKQGHIKDTSNCPIIGGEPVCL